LVLDSRIGRFINAYKIERNEFTRDKYVDKNRWYRKMYCSYANWDSFDVLKEENAFNARMVSKVKNACIPKESLAITNLSLKNRIEYLSDQVDFFTGFITFVILMFSSMIFIFKASIPDNPIICTIEDLKYAIPVIYFVLLIIIGVFTYKKSVLRTEIASIKEIINIFENSLS